MLVTTRSAVVAPLVTFKLLDEQRAYDAACVTLDKEGKEKMTCKSALYTVNDTNPTITTTASIPIQVPFGSIVRRFGRYVTLNGDSILCCDSGYFDVNISITASPVAAEPITAQLYQDGTAVPGAFVTVDPADAGSPVALPITALVRNCGCGSTSTLTVKLNANCTVNNFACVVEKL